MARRKDPNSMSFLEHLEELRWRLVRSFAAIAVGGSLAFIFKAFIFDQIILAPSNATFVTYKWLCSLGRFVGAGESLCLTADFSLQNIEMSGQFTAHLVVSIITGFIIAFPYIFYQVWQFVSPGMSSRERQASRGVVAACSFLFLCGVLFGYYLIAPLSVQFLAGYQVSELVANQISLNSFISTVVMVSLWCGIIFELPVVVFFLARLGLVTAAGMRKVRKHALVGILIVSAIITPPDITSQLLVSLPLLLLYEVSIHVARVVERPQKKVASSSLNVTRVP